ncbi:MAG TPA: endonuclease domain-containing protein [Rhodanobacteraceae bacterium]|nr:endonuclease domain-containing protein [Rhodanobacteraceae bacterium]
MQGQTNKQILGEHRQRSLRNNATDAERALLQRLKGRQLEGCKFRRQHPFGDFILDFVCLERHVVELDGSQHFDAAAYDEMRSRFLRLAGFGILRFRNNDVFSDLDGMLEVNRRERVVRGRTPSPPNPPLEGEG